MRGTRNSFDRETSGERGGVSPPVRSPQNREADPAPLACRTRGRARHSGVLPRSGFTIAEILLVLAVLVVISGLVFPPVLRLMADQPLKEAAERARSQLANVRIKALDTNVAWQFRFEPGGSHYLWMPQEAASASSANGNTAGASSSTGASQSGPQTSELPKGIVFASDINGLPFGIEHLPAELVMGSSNSYELTQVAWSAPLTFQPDGSAADSELAVVDARDRQMRLIVRGLTGGVIVTPMETRKR